MAGSCTRACSSCSRRFTGARRGSTASARSAIASTISVMRSRRLASPRRWPAGGARCCRNGRSDEIARARPASIATRTSSMPSGRSPAACWRVTSGRDRTPLSGAVAPGRCRARRVVGRANQLSEDHVSGRSSTRSREATRDPALDRTACRDVRSICDAVLRSRATRVVLQRRSAVAFDGARSIPVPDSSRCCGAHAGAGAAFGTRCGGRRGFISRCSCTASTASSPGSICCRATSRPASA